MKNHAMLFLFYALLIYCSYCLTKLLHEIVKLVNL